MERQMRDKWNFFSPLSRLTPDENYYNATVRNLNTMKNNKLKIVFFTSLLGNWSLGQNGLKRQN